VQQKTVLTRTMTMDYTVYFRGDKELLLYNEEDNTLTLYDLSTGRSVQLLDAQYFAENAAFSEVPFSFDYSEEMDVCFFANATDVGDKGWEVRVTATDVEGNVLGQSPVLNVSFANASTMLLVQDGMIFFVIISDNAYEEAANGVCTLIYRARYTYNTQGDLIFIQ
jgi:hypothetical protein